MDYNIIVFGGAFIVAVIMLILIVRPKVMRCKDGHRHLTSLEIKFNVWWIRCFWNPITLYYKGKWYDEEGLPF